MQITLATVDCLRGGAKSSIGWRVLSARRKSSSILCILMSKQCSGNREQISHKLIGKKLKFYKNIAWTTRRSTVVGVNAVAILCGEFSNQAVPRILLHIHGCASLFYPQNKILLHSLHCMFGPLTFHLFF